MADCLIAKLIFDGVLWNLIVFDCIICVISQYLKQTSIIGMERLYAFFWSKWKLFFLSQTVSSCLQQVCLRFSLTLIHNFHNCSNYKYIYCIASIRIDISIFLIFYSDIVDFWYQFVWNFKKKWLIFEKICINWAY